jgi:hypothetical protein
MEVVPQSTKEPFLRRDPHQRDEEAAGIHKEARATVKVNKQLQRVACVSPFDEAMS